MIENAVAERRPWSLDYRIVRPDGELRMIHARGEVVCDEQGRPAVVQGTCQDVTESRRVEDALRAAEQLFRRAFDDAPIGMALIDLEGRWLRLNRAISQMLGRSEPELRTMQLSDLNHPDDRRLDRPLIKELLNGRRRSFAVEKRYVHADGHLIHALVHVSLMHGDGERPLYFLCQLVDITERRRAEAERRAVQERMQAIIDNSPALVIVKDPEQRYLLVNRRWEHVTGLDGGEVLGRTSADVLGDRSPAQDDVDREVLATGEVRENMATMPGLDGEEITFLVVKFPLRDAEGQISGVCTISTDITERRRSDEERAELEARLAQAQRLESIGQLAGGVAHDFNNLLSVILTCVGFAQRELSADDPVRDDVEEIGRAADRAAALTRQLLMFSRREVVTPKLVDVATLARDLEHLLNRTLSERVALRISCGPDVVPVLIDPDQLEQVLVNLAVNARDAMPEGGTLSIAVAGGEGGVRITVADDGTGMPAEVRERAFEPFFTTKEEGEGTGLGLASVHGAVTNAGGTVDIASEVGGGTVVRSSCRRHGRRCRPEEPAEPRARARRRRERAGGRGPGPGPPPGVPDPRGQQLQRARGGERRRGARALGAGRRARHRRRHAGHERPAARRARARARARPARRLHVRPHRRRRSSATARAMATSRSSRSPSRATRCCARSRRRWRVLESSCSLDAAAADRAVRRIFSTVCRKPWNGSFLSPRCSPAAGTPDFRRETRPSRDAQTPRRRETPSACGAGAPQRRRLAHVTGRFATVSPYAVADPSPCSSAPLTPASSAFSRCSASASGDPKRRCGAASAPWWVRTQWASARRRPSSRPAVRARSSTMRSPISTWPSSRPSSVSPISAPSVNSRVRPRSWTSAAVSSRSWSSRGCSAHASSASVPTATVCSSSPPR